MEGFHYYAESKYNNIGHQNWFTRQRRIRQTIPLSSETKNMVDSHPQTRFIEVEPFLAHQKPQHCSSALCVSLIGLRQPLHYSGRACVTPEGLTLPLRCPDWACVSPVWLLLPLLHCVALGCLCAARYATSLPLLYSWPGIRSSPCQYCPSLHRKHF